MTFKELSNSTWLWILVIAGLLYVAGLAAAFMVKARKRCLELGIENTTIKKVISSSCTFSIVPSLSIVIGLISLAAVLGTPWAWFRLSVVGAVSYELMAADMVIQAMGLNFASAGAQPANVFGAVMIVMSIGIMFGIITNIIAAKKITTSMADYNRKSGGWGAVFSGCFMMAMMSVMMPLQVYNPATGWNFVGTLTLLTSAGIGLLIATIAKKTGAKWLNDFNLAIVLILGMASSVLWTNVVGMFA
ncbi:DUF5058 family protein [Bittarella massiliensis (ex Durand et al. 2017)]|uniref:DUF5058 family protein n=1 Tax=Bittarella massiliensis (ex Durand et al. 2017) TaxID=1720313 RepID=UPI00073F2A27|nr:DUF5058 family protein [Bittarella massiliensis (ex Durand et al. 2017)]